MFSLLGADAVNEIVNFIGDIIGSLTFDQLFYIFVGVIAAIILISGIRLIWCYENRSVRAMKRVNKYLKDNPKINDDNLVEFHKRMKMLPRRMRDRWQLFMLEREGSPSRYMTVEYCVKRPLYNSAITMSQKQVWYITIILAVLGFIFGLACVATNGLGTNIPNTLVYSFVIPAIVLILGSIYVMILQVRYNAINHDFYDMFTNFVRNIDKATNTMPDYVDYELLFTKKEIDKGIPVLREYLEKRAMEEQRLLEKAKREETNHSPYDFSSLGVNGAQLIERAVTESEKFLTNKIQTQNEINDLEKQLQKSDANMEDIEREANKKLQAIKENLERLDKAMAETTNRVEINYNRRQADAEMDKKLLLEKDLENMLSKEKVAQDALKVEIQKRKEIIEENKKEVEEALKSEYDTFATKVYDELNEKITRDNSEQLHEMEMTIARLKAKVKEFTRDIEKKDSIIEARNLELDNMRQQLSKQRGKSKSKKEFGQEYIKAQENNPDGTINAVQVDYSQPETQGDVGQNGTENYVGNDITYTETAGGQPTEPQYDYSQTDVQPDYAGYADGAQMNEYSNVEQGYDGQQTYDANGQPIDAGYNDGQQYYYDENGNMIDNGQFVSEQPTDSGTVDGVQDGQPVDSGAGADQMQYEQNAAQYGDQSQVYYDENGNPVYDTQYTDNGQYGMYGNEQYAGDNAQYSVDGQNAVDFGTANEGLNIPADNTEFTDPNAQVSEEPAAENVEGNSGLSFGEPTENAQNANEQAQAVDLGSTQDGAEVVDFSTAQSEESDKVSDKVENDEATNAESVDLSNVSSEESNTTENTGSEEKADEKEKTDTNKKDDKAEAKKDDVEEIKPAKKSTSKKFTESVKSKETSDKKDDKAENSKDDEDKVDKKSVDKETEKDEKSTDKKEDKKKYVENDDLEALQKKIEEENARLKKQQEELRAQIDKTLATMEKAENATKAERTRNIKKIKEMISKLKEEAETAKARGASKTMINKINKSAAELLKVLAEYQSKK